MDSVEISTTSRRNNSYKSWNGIPLIALYSFSRLCASEYPSVYSYYASSWERQESGSTVSVPSFFSIFLPNYPLPSSYFSNASQWVKFGIQVSPVTVGHRLRELASTWPRVVRGLTMLQSCMLRLTLYWPLNEAVAFFCDWWLASLPIVFVWNVRIGAPTKIGISVLVGFGFW